jgi:6-phosphogluconolactonase
MKSETVLVRKLAVGGMVSLLLLAGCGGGTSPSSIGQPTSSGSNPTPTITTISPSCTVPGGAAFTLTISGTNFVAASMVNFGGAAPATTFVNSTQLTAAIPAASIASTGTPAVTVTNPTPGGGSSNASTFTITTGTVDPQSIAVDPAGKFAYVASEGCDGAGYVSMYTINPTTGALASIGPPVSSLGYSADSVTVDPFGKFAYVANLGDGGVAMYTINATTGALASIGPPVSSRDYNADSVTVDPFGKFAYVANLGDDETSDGSVAMYTIDATTGGLTFIGGISGNCPGLCVPLSVVVDPSGKFAYVPNGDGIVPSSVAMYTINATTGALTSIGTIAIEGFAGSVTVDPSGKFAYVATPNATFGSAGNVSIYTINATTGALAAIGTIAAGTGPVSAVVDPSGKFAYVANSASNDVSMYTIDATTGGLTPSGTIATGPSPTSIAIHPSGKFAYVTNSGSNSVSMYSIDSATGTLTLIGTIGT